MDNAERALCTAVECYCGNHVFTKHPDRKVEDFYPPDEVEHDRCVSCHIGGLKEGLEIAAEILEFKTGEDKLTFDKRCIDELREQPEAGMRKLLSAFADEIRAKAREVK